MVQIWPILYSSQPIRLQIFFRVSDKCKYSSKLNPYPKFLIPETIKSLQISKKVITKEGCGENMQ